MSQNQSPDFGWDIINFLPSSCCGMDLVWEECW